MGEGEAQCVSAMFWRSLGSAVFFHFIVEQEQRDENAKTVQVTQKH
jgi:hypothetical protein